MRPMEVACGSTVGGAVRSRTRTRIPACSAPWPAPRAYTRGSRTTHREADRPAGPAQPDDVPTVRPRSQTCLLRRRADAGRALLDGPAQRVIGDLLPALLPDGEVRAAGELLVLGHRL